jgi:hypothetical protein
MGVCAFRTDERADNGDIGSFDVFRQQDGGLGRGEAMFEYI